MSAFSPADALAVHAAALVIDTHADTSQRFVDEGWDFGGELGEGMLSLDSARAGGLGAEFFALWVEPVAWAGRFAHRTLKLLDGVLEQVERHQDRMALCTSSEEILAAHKAGKFAALLGVEGGHSIENDLALLRLYYRLGVRYMTLTWANTNDWADSSGDMDDASVMHHGGLTEFGREVVREMNRLGMMVDVSHVSDETFWQVLETSRVPVIASHSSARALTDVPRNLTDEMIRALVAKGGVVMVNFYPAFIDATWGAAWDAQYPERAAAKKAFLADYGARGEKVPGGAWENVVRAFARKLPRTPFSALIDHIDHVAKVAGMEHVGIGTDFDGIPGLPEGIDSAADLPKVTGALMQRGYTADDMAKLLGGNLLRVFAEISDAKG
jgi:membrane dipeptidase